jgi:preprotein translocase subunit SecA
MLHGSIVEMQTGEGKTLTAPLAAIVMALTGTPVHVITANDYLVSRDAGHLQDLYALFGLRCAAIVETSSAAARRRAYAADIVYGTSKQLVFDYLRDLQIMRETRAGLKSELRPLLSTDIQEPMMRGLCFAIVDEADSTLVDDARMPLILAEPARNGRNRVAEAAVALSIARGLHRDVDFRLHEDDRTLRLTDAGRDALRQLTERLTGTWRFERYRNELVRQALTALHLFRLDRDYLVKDGRVQLIDESTGRVLPDRKLQHGLHRMLEVKEKCSVTEDNEILAAISFQRFFKRYHHLAGMSGTVREVRRELRRVYGLEVVPVPTKRPCLRTVERPVVLPDRNAQLAWAATEVAARQANRQPVLIGTRTVEVSEIFSAMLRERGIDHQLLNARHDAQEAEIVARAGISGAVTVATNMAGRGTDIPLDEDSAQAGGLYVIGLEVNESRRVERQLFGRCARQGDPGSARAIVSLKDDLVLSMIPKAALSLTCWAAEQLPGAGPWLARMCVRSAQRLCERRHRKERMRIYNGSGAVDRALAVSGDTE